MNKEIIKNIQTGLLVTVGAVIAIGLIIKYPDISRAYQFRKIPAQINEIAKQIKTYKDSHNSYEGLDNMYLTENELLPDDIIYYDDEPNIINQSGGVYIVNSASSDINEINQDAFAINYQNIDKNTCIRMATYDWNKLEGVKLLGFSASLFTLTGDIVEIVDGCDGLYNPNGLMYACPNGKEVSIPAPRDMAETVCQCFDRYSCSIILKFE